MKKMQTITGANYVLKIRIQNLTRQLVNTEAYTPLFLVTT